jgi:hypothetical protein
MPGALSVVQVALAVTIGPIQMNRKRRISLWAASLEVGGYPQLLSNLARENGLEVQINGRARYLNRDDLEQLDRLVRDWLNRPRMSRRSREKSRDLPA